MSVLFTIIVLFFVKAKNNKIFTEKRLVFKLTTLALIVIRTIGLTYAFVFIVSNFIYNLTV